MTPYEDFLMELYYAKLKWGSIQLGYIPVVWNDTIQNQINAFSNFVSEDLKVEAHIIAAQSYFVNKFSLEIILKIISVCLKEQCNNSNEHAFTMCVYNRLQLLNQNT